MWIGLGSVPAGRVNTPLAFTARAQRSLTLHASTRGDSASVTEGMERLRLHNLSPQPGSRKAKTRKGRGYSAGQGGSCGFGMRGQKSRSGSGVRHGFEGGQTPLYRRLPKLRGVAGGMPAGRKTHIIFNLGHIPLPVDMEVSRDMLCLRGVLKPTGSDRNLPLKILAGEGWAEPRTYYAAAFSKAAIAAIEAAGGTAIVEPTKTKWRRQRPGKQRDDTGEDAADGGAESDD